MLSDDSDNSGVVVSEVKSEVRGRSGPSPWGPPAHLALAGISENRLGALCPIWLQSPHQGPPLAFEASSEPLPCPYLFDPVAMAVSLGCCPWDLVSPPWGVLRRLRGHLGWAPGSFSDDRWGGSGDLALRELPAELCLLLARPRTLEGESCSLGHCSFISGQRITFVW